MQTDNQLTKQTALPDNAVFLLGTRGSLPVSGPEFTHFGGNTTCVYVRLGGRGILLDAGSGLLRLPAEALAEPALPLLLTHPHADHLLGLPLCPYAMTSGHSLDIYAGDRGGLNAREQVLRLLSPPLWPVTTDLLPASVTYHALPESLQLGLLRVESMEGVHPGGVSVLRVTGVGRSVVFATDCTVTPALRPALLEFARDCDLLLMDGQYSDSEWEYRSTFGHNTWTAAARFGAQCGAKAMRVVHHDPWRTDQALRAAEQEVRGIFPRCSFGKDGEVISL